VAKTKEIALTSPITGHGGAITRLTVREPKAADFFDLGEPQVIARNPDGTVYAVENDAAVREYVSRCVVDCDPLLLRQLCLADAMAVKAAVLDFFLAARQAQSGS
jgi:hypothetical protein